MAKPTDTAGGPSRVWPRADRGEPRTWEPTGPLAGSDPPTRRLRVCYISRSQFGYMVPTYYNCLYLLRHCNLRIVTLDKCLPRYDLPGALVEYAPHRPSTVRRWASLISTAVRANRPPVDVTLVEHFSGCGFIPLLSRSVPIVLDIRSGSVARSRVHRTFANALARWDSRAYSHVSVISSGLGARLGLPPTATHVVPLGAVERVGPDKNYGAGLRLLYVGTLSGRRIEDTLHGIALFIARNPTIPFESFDIIGSGLRDEAITLRGLAARLGLAKLVKFHGFIHQIHLDRFYEDANVGISYVPRTDYYDVQPPTKTFEYLLAGMPVLATATREHLQVIDDTNGVLIDDTPDSFCEGLLEVWRRGDTWSSNAIRASVNAYSWQRIIDDVLWPLLQRIGSGGAPTPMRSNPNG